MLMETIKFIERFDGVVENIDNYKGDDSQTYVKVEGRDEFRKLVNPIINKNYNFSEDYILSSNTFTPNLLKPEEQLARQRVTQFMEQTVTKPFRHTAAALTTELSVGDGLFAKWSTGAIAYIGRLANYTPSSNLITLEDFRRLLSMKHQMFICLLERRLIKNMF